MSRSYIITDVGSTTTKAVLIGPKGGESRLIGRVESPTTVEQPFEDVTVGVLSSLKCLEESIDQRLIGTAGIEQQSASASVPLIESIPKLVPLAEDCRYLSTSSAGGGLQILVFGLTRNVTAESAQRAALGGGAIILDVMATDDGRQSFAKIDPIRDCRPDMILISGGVDGGNTDFALEICDILNAASPRARFGESFRIPVIFAGNTDAIELVKDTLSDQYDVTVVPNLRPTLFVEDLNPARDAIHNLFMSHVMKQAPGYDRLRSWVDGDILPTPAAVGRIMELVSARKRLNTVGVDIGGATTDIFSVIGGMFFRSVSANLGMSYSAGNVLVEAGVDNVARWLTFQMDTDHVADRILTKLINPTTVPQDETDLKIEQALAIEAIRLSYRQHLQVATMAPRRPVSVWTRLVTGSSGEGRLSAVDMANVGLLIGSGGVLSHAPRRNQAAWMMLNAFLPECVSNLAVDSIFMMPHLGVLSHTDPDAALTVLEKDCLIPLGPVIAPQGQGVQGQPGVSLRVISLGVSRSVDVNGGDIAVVRLPAGQTAKVQVECHGGFNLKGASRVECEVTGGVLGIIIDARGRPLVLPEDPVERVAAISKWTRQIGAYDSSGGDLR